MFLSELIFNFTEVGRCTKNYPVILASFCTILRCSSNLTIRSGHNLLGTMNEFCFLIIRNYRS